MKIPKILLLVLFCLGCQSAGFAATIYVKPNASGAKNGTSWANAYTSLQSALSAAQNGDSLWIAAGTYKPATNGNTDAYFSVVKSLSIFGGFDGTETTLNQRDWKANATILSGDLDGNDTGPGSNQNDNSKRVIVVSNTSGVLIDGISITGGNCPTPGVGPDTGAGLDVFSSMTIRNCKFFWNYAISYGGALAVRGEGVQALIENCSFTNNVGDWNGGGAMFVESASATIKNSYFANNSGSRGGAVQLNGTQNIRFENSVFVSNYSRGGLGSDGGGAIWIFNGPGQKLEVIHCTFLNNSNSRGSGGAIRLDSEYDSGSTLIANSIFAGSSQNAVLNFQGTITSNLFDSAISGVTTSLDSPTFTNPNNPLGSDGVFGTRDDGLILAQNSNGIAKAVSAFSLESDATGSKRHVNSSVDIGAYQTAVYVQGPTDSDGDGVNDYREGEDGTDPNNASSFDPLSKGLVAFYPFNGNVKDESGWGRDGAVVSGSFGSDKFGKEAGSFTITQDSNYATIPLNSIQFSGDLTIVAIVSFEDFQKNFPHILHGENAFLVLHGLGPAYEWDGKVGEVTYLEYIRIGNSDFGLMDFDRRSEIYSSKKLNPKQWYQICVTRTNDTTKMFIDGVLCNSVASKNSALLSGNFIQVGKGNLSDPNQSMRGSIDDLKFYNRALSAAEVSQLYSKESGNSNMVTVQGGTLPQGSELAGQAVGTFQISKFETTWGEWKAVRDWAVNNGYTDLANIGAGRGDNFPVSDVSWYDVLKWCNAKSQMEGLSPVYQFGGLTYRNGQSVPSINSAANGYRLPLEKESEWAARGGTLSKGYYYSGSNDLDSVAWYMDSGQVQVVGGKLSNELGIYDMSGNIWEWVWDIYEPVPVHRRFRSGCWNPYAGSGAVSFRDGNSPPQNRLYWLGFRLVRNSGTPDTTAPVIAITSISANARLTSANATFGGTITETGGKPTLQYRLGTTGNWTSSTVGGSASPYSFSQLVALKPGPNTVQFQAKDDAGNTSTLASVNVSYVVASTLTITAPNAADGSVTSGFGGSTSREVGVSYTVTATPASGMVFKEWLKNGVSTSTNATLKFTMQPGLTLKPVFVPDFAKLGGFYNGLVGVGAIGNGTAADMQAFAANNGFLQLTSGTNGALSGVLKIEGKSHSFNGTMGANKRATITVPRPGKGNATLSLSLISALPGEISGNVTTSGAPLAFRALRAAYTAGAAKHALAGKRYAIVLPPPSGLAMGYGHATLTVEDNGAAVLSGVLANGQAVNAGARIVDDGAGNWVFPVYVGASGIFTGEIVIPKTTPASGSELGGSLEWLKPASNTGLFKSGFLKSLQPLGATHSPTSAGLGGAAFRLTLDPAKRILSAAVVQAGTWANSGSPSLTTPVKSGLTVSFNPLSGKFEGSFTRTVNSAPLPTPIQGTLFSRPIPIPGGATLRGAGFFTSGNASTSVEVTTP
jgi:formylglycine-generating enzyme required for sulfatase activity